MAANEGESHSEDGGDSGKEEEQMEIDTEDKDEVFVDPSSLSKFTGTSLPYNVSFEWFWRSVKRPFLG